MEYLWYEITSNKWGIPLIVTGGLLIVGLLYAIYLNMKKG